MPYNNQEARNHIVEIITVMTVCNKQKPLQLCKITDDQFEEHQILNKIQAEERYVLFRPVDPKSIQMPINEFAYHLYKNDHSHTSKENCIYWLQWLFTLDKKRKKKRKKDIVCAARPNQFVDSKFYTHYVFILWHIIRNHPDIRSNPKSKQMQIVQSLYRLYCNDFKKSSLTQHKWFIFYAVLIVLNTHPSFNFESMSIIPSNIYKTVIVSQMHVNDLYKKVHEESVCKIQEQRNIQQLQNREKRSRKFHSYSDRENTHFSEFMNNKMYLYKEDDD